MNRVGVEVNTASAALLGYVAGIGPSLAQAIVTLRDRKGGFTSRKDLTEVPRLGAKAFEQAAGFLRVRGGAHNTCARICGERWSQLAYPGLQASHMIHRIVCPLPRIIESSLATILCARLGGKIGERKKGEEG